MAQRVCTARLAEAKCSVAMKRSPVAVTSVSLSAPGSLGEVDSQAMTSIRMTAIPQVQCGLPFRACRVLK
ncbi:hypothetical protein D3C87_1812790 [compost metagenome]